VEYKNFLSLTLKLKQRNTFFTFHIEWEWKQRRQQQFAMLVGEDGAVSSHITAGGCRQGCHKPQIQMRLPTSSSSCCHHFDLHKISTIHKIGSSNSSSGNNNNKKELLIALKDEQTFRNIIAADWFGRQQQKLPPTMIMLQYDGTIRMLLNKGRNAREKKK